MPMYDRIKALCRQKGVTVTGTEKELGFARGSLCKVDTNKPSMERVNKLADYFGVSVEYLMSGEIPAEKKDVTLTPRDERDIEKILDQTREQLLSQEGLMFDGQPATPEAIDSILSAMQVGMEPHKKHEFTLFFVYVLYFVLHLQRWYCPGLGWGRF